MYKTLNVLIMKLILILLSKLLIKNKLKKYKKSLINCLKWINQKLDMNFL
jgi:hypothetical protein